MIPHILPNLLALSVGSQKVEGTHLIFLMQILLNFTLFCSLIGNDGYRIMMSV